MQPIYFLPNVVDTQVYDATKERGLNRKVLEAHGLLGIFGDLNGRGDISVSNTETKNWKTKNCPPGSGCLLAYGAPDKFTTPGSLEWQDGTPWIGFDPANPPTEAELKRKRQVGGYRIDMEDGTSWLVPIIRRPDDSTELPCDMFYEQATGALKEPVKEAYREYWEASAEVASWFFNDSGEFGGDTFTKPKAFDLAVKALGINYRFGHAEQRVCKVVTSENMLSVLMFTIDFPRYHALTNAQKKSSSPLTTAITTLGPLEDSATIDLPAQTSGAAL